MLRNFTWRRIFNDRHEPTANDYSISACIGDGVEVAPGGDTETDS
jgi:hypothetical protein